MSLATDKTWPNRNQFRSDDDLQSGAVIVHPSFRDLIGGDDVEIHKHYTGTEWAEGPAYVPARNGSEGFVVFSDVPNNRMLKYDPVSGETTTFREPSHYSNGNTIDNEGRLVTCEHLRHAISRLEHDGKHHILVDSFEGKKLNSPNDLVVKSDGSIWFTDPPYGILSGREGNARDSELDGNYVYRLEPDTGNIAIVVNELDRPNGLAFSPDESILYVADSGEPRNVAAFDVNSDGKSLSNFRIFAVVRPGIADGFRCDIQGNMWTSAHDGIHCLTPEGELIGKILIPEQRTANCTFGDEDRKTLYICGDVSLYSVRLNVAGA